MKAPPRVAVATSGGRDSTALLHSTLRAARPLGIEVWALHVHHGLMAEADGWLVRVRDQARRWGARFDARRLQGAPARGDSVEAWARLQRYQALAEMAHAAGCPLVLLAHHRQDQAETWLLQALRGAGHLGLAAMPRLAERHGLTWARPWLDQDRDSIDAYRRRHRLQAVDDASNDDPRYARSRLRTQVWPALLRAFPDAPDRLADAAAHAHEASLLAAEVARQDLQACGAGQSLPMAPWLALSEPRRSNSLRAWLRERLEAAAPPTLVHRLLDELPRTRNARWPAPRGQQLALHRGALHVVAIQPDGAANPTITLDLSSPGLHPMPRWGGAWRVERVAAGGVEPEVLRSVVLRGRAGTDRFRVAPRAAARSLKKQFQARDVPAWARGAPVLAAPDGRVLFVPGLGVDAAFQAAPGRAQLGIAWQPL